MRNNQFIFIAFSILEREREYFDEQIDKKEKREKDKG